jgi:hypothetical protein
MHPHADRTYRKLDKNALDTVAACPAPHFINLVLYVNNALFRDPKKHFDHENDMEVTDHEVAPMVLAYITVEVCHT